MNVIDEKVLFTIRNKYKDLYSAEKKVADYILNNPKSSVNMNVSDLSESANVSEATVVRMCQHLGFDGFYQMKLILMRDIGSQSNNVVNKVYNPIEFLKNEKEITFESINYKKNLQAIKKLVKNIQSAKNIFIVSAGNTIPVANDLEFRLNRLGFSAFSSQVLEKTINYIINSKESDIIILISKSGLSKTVLQASSIATNKNLQTFAITGDISSPLANKTKNIIFSGKNSIVSNSNFHGTESHIGELFINDILVYSLASILNEKNQNDDLTSELEYFSSWKI